MNANVGGIDRVLRGVVGLVLIAVGALAGLSAPWNMVAIAVGAVMGLTALIRFCPLYPILGINTCRQRNT
ncbi:MAG: DUF2892 domain-containing protein [Zetaproteobacteria bacterium]|nr:MAG: DUF2892 domain-containing protein [Zetaproteobacteria bacterium]